MINIPQAIGIGGAILMTYDAVHTGTQHGLNKTRDETATELTDVYLSHQTASRPSSVLENVKSWYRTSLLDDQVIPAIRNVKNVFLSSVNELVHYAIPIGLSIAAFKCPKNIIGKVSAGIVSLMGLKIFMQDVVGIGKEKYLE